jgi:hypothetical protein
MLVNTRNNGIHADVCVMCKCIYTYWKYPIRNFTDTWNENKAMLKCFKPKVVGVYLKNLIKSAYREGLEGYYTQKENIPTYYSTPM